MDEPPLEFFTWEWVLRVLLRVASDLGLSQNRSLDSTPPPHVLEQEPHSDQAPQPPLTEGGVQP